MSLNLPQIVPLLKALRIPTSAANISERFQCPLPAVEGLLRQLKARGMVSLAEPGHGDCFSGCGSCSMKNFCPSSAKDQEPSILLPRTAGVWRLTPLGEKAVTE